MLKINCMEIFKKYLMASLGIISAIIIFAVVVYLFVFLMDIIF